MASEAGEPDGRPVNWFKLVYMEQIGALRPGRTFHNCWTGWPGARLLL